METLLHPGEPWLSPGRFFLSPRSITSLCPPAPLQSPVPLCPISSPQHPPGLPIPRGQAYPPNLSAPISEPIIPEIISERGDNSGPSPDANTIRAEKPRIVECPNKMIVDLTFFAVWLAFLWDKLQYMLRTADRVIRVKTFVTGYWETRERKEYCLGPITNPLPRHFKGDKIHVVVTEESTTIKHSFWPTLTIGTPGDITYDENDDIGWAISEFNVPCEPEPPKFPGQMKRSEVCGIHRAMYILLFLSRVLCFVIVQCAIYALPYPPPTGRILQSDYELFQDPTAENVLQAQVANLYTPEIYKPFRPDLIRGPEAVKAARRAGYKFLI